MSELKRLPNHPGLSEKTLKIIQVLREHAGVGNVVTDEELQAATGESTAPGGNGYGHLQSAVNYLLREDGVVWARVREAGAIKHLDAEENIEARRKAPGKIARIAKKERRKLACTPLDAVEPKDRPGVLALSAQLGTLAQFSASKVTKTLEARNVDKPIDFYGTIKLLGKGPQN
jgi:hypothetical protein